MLHIIFNRKSSAYLFLIAALLLLVACGGTEPPADGQAVEETTETETTEQEVSGDAEQSDTVIDTAASTETTASDTTTDTTAAAPPNNNLIGLEKIVFDPFEEIIVTVDLNVSDDSTAWVGIVPSAVPHGSESESDLHHISYTYISNNDNGVVIFVAPEEIGAYDVRLFSSDDAAVGIELASVSFTVIPAEEAQTDTNTGGTTASTDTDSEETAETEATTEEAETPATEPETTANGNDACLQGSWRVSNFDAYFAASVKDAMNGQDIEISSESSGDLLLMFEGDVMSMSDNNFAVTVTMMGTTVPTDVDASGTATYTADGSLLTGYIENVNVQETSQGVGINLSGLVGQPVTYTCNEAMMVWSGPYAIPVELTRIN